MANKEHIELLKKGAKVWNEWRRNHFEYRSDLRGAILIGIDLSGAELEGVDFQGADLSGANLVDADLNGACLSGADLGGADLSGAELYNVELVATDLTGANLSGAKLSGAILGYTLIANVDVSEVKGLGEVEHIAPSSIGIDTIYQSKGKIPPKFLREAGVPENFIEYMNSLTGKAFDYYSCFISYSKKDEEFAKRLYTDLQTEGVGCWLDSEDLKIGRKIRLEIEKAIRIHDKLLLVLSESSLKSTWVDDEVETAFEKERKENKSVLFPVRLDETIFETEVAWAADIRRTRHIGDFKNWQNHTDYKKGFDRLLRDLKADEKKAPDLAKG